MVVLVLLSMVMMTMIGVGDITVVVDDDHDDVGFGVVGGDVTAAVAATVGGRA